MAKNPAVERMHDMLDEYVAAQIIGDIRLNHIRDARMAFERSMWQAVRDIRNAQPTEGRSDAK